MSGKPLSARLQTATRAMHAAAERSGVMARLLRGDIDLAGYCVLLRNLHALYAALESALDWHAGDPELGRVRFPALFRAPALEADLSYLHGEGWSALTLTAAMHSYCARIEGLRDAQPWLLAAHAYVRYLGDLSGGQVLCRIVRRVFGLVGGAGTQFYAFGERDDIEAHKARLRCALDALPLDAAGVERMAVEANAAFALHVRLFDELEAGLASPPGAALHRSD